ncbi:MAG: hypothetical protein ABL957_09115 [Parvularculaceae bacterium]
MAQRNSLTFFDPEHVERPIPGRPWRAILFGALGATALLTAGWEAFWRSKGLIPGDYKNSDALWAEQRRKAVGEATAIVGSSRILFDVDLDIWEELSGVRPVQLALEGTSPRAFLKDLADDPSFNGFVIVGVTTVLFFTQEGGLRESALKFHREETLSQRADHLLSMPLEQFFAFIDDQSRPRRQVQIWPFPLREGMLPRFDPRKLEIMTADRNTEMWARVVNDPAYQAEAKAQWEIGFRIFAPPPGPNGEPPAPMPPEAVGAVIAGVKIDIDKIRARGGEVAFMRLPYGGGFAPVEDNGFPRAQFWDRLLRETNSVGVAWQDHAELQGYELPEWSHLSPREAERYTRALVPIFYERLEAEGRKTGKPASRPAE